jgi:sigma-B regulation protein RsbU (phosphoserine phosphatase)
MAQRNTDQSIMAQRQIYRIVDKMASGQYSSEMELLSSVMREIVGRAEIEITGGRIWELAADEDAYVLRYQYGSLEEVPEEYTIYVDDYPLFAQLPAKRTIMEYETDKVLRGHGVHFYSATGVGELLKRDAGKLYKYVLAFNPAEHNAKFHDVINIISSAVGLRLRELERQHEQRILEKDLNQAWEIQRSLLPDHERLFNDYHIFGISVPDRVVGGDYFDYLKPSSDYEQRLSVVISDAASKGMPAAIQALFVSGAVRMGVGFDTKISALIGRLNTLIYETFPYERFVTLFYCEITQSETGLVMYANAGHCSPIHYRSKTRDCRMLPSTGGLLGLTPDERFSIENVNMRYGDILLLYTDGIVEAMNKQGKLFGEQRLKTLLRKNAGKSAKEIAYICIEEAQKFSAGSEYSDDKTVVVIKREPPEQGVKTLAEGASR